MSSPKEDTSEPQPQLATSTPLHKLIPGKSACLAQPAPLAASCSHPASLPRGGLERRVMPPLQTSVVLSARGRQQGLLHTPLHQTTGQAGKEQGKRAPSEPGLLQQGTFQIHSAGSMAVPRAQPGAARCFAHTVCCLLGQSSSQLMENFDMTNFIVFVQLGLKSNSTETLGWP